MDDGLFTIAGDISGIAMFFEHHYGHSGIHLIVFDDEETRLDVTGRLDDGWFIAGDLLFSQRHFLWQWDAHGETQPEA